MKQRMYNTFSRIFKNHAIAKVLSEVGYALLMAYYMVARNFVKSRKKKIYDASKVREELLLYAKSCNIGNVAASCLTHEPKSGSKTTEPKK